MESDFNTWGWIILGLIILGAVFIWRNHAAKEKTLKQHMAKQAPTATKSNGVTPPAVSASPAPKMTPKRKAAPKATAKPAKPAAKKPARKKPAAKTTAKKPAPKTSTK